MASDTTMRGRLRNAVHLVIAMACLLALGPSGEARAASPRAEAAVERALRAVEAAGEARGTTDPTIALRDLALALPALDGPPPARARSVLSRPASGGSPYGGSWPAGAEEKVVQRPRFVVHYAEVAGCDVSPPKPDPNCDEPNLADQDANGIPDYVDASVAAIERSIAVENGELGWPLPKGDGATGEPGGSLLRDRLDIYLSDLCDERDFEPCVFGFVTPDDNSAECKSAPFQCSAHIVVDNDYAEFGSSGGELGLRVTTAHEYSHVLQYRISSNQDDWMLESTATWFEEQVFPEDDDWVRSYSDYWARTPGTPITEDDFRFYGSAVWNHWLERGDAAYGPDVILDAWQSSRDVDPKDYAVGAFDRAIRDHGGGGFSKEFAAFTAATAEWNAGDGGFPDASELTEVKRAGKIAIRGEARTRTLDNTSYALFDVNPKDASELRLKGRSEGGVQWAVALVGRDGSRFGGEVTRDVAYSGGGRRSSAVLEDAQSYERITAVVTNADGSVGGPKPDFRAFAYQGNNETFRLRLK